MCSTFFETYPAKNGGICRVFIGSKVYILASSPELIEPVITSHKHINKGVDYGLIQKWLGDALLISSGEQLGRSMMNDSLKFL